MYNIHLKALPFIMGLVLSVSINAQTENLTYVNSEWVSQSPVVGDGIYHSSSITVSNKLVVTSKVVNGAGDTDIATIKYSSNGDTLWMKTFGGTAGLDDYGIELAATSTGDIIVVGTTQNTSTEYDYTVLRYASSTGSLLWSYTWNGAANGIDIPTDIVIDGSDNIYVTGGSADVSDLSDYATVKLSPSGVFQWASLYDYNNLHDAASTIEHTGSRVVVSGASAAALSDWDLASLKLNPSTGAVININRSDVAGATITEASSMVTDTDNNVYITGYAEISGNKNIQTIKLDSNLALVWIADYIDTLNDVGNDIDIDGSGNVYVTGYTEKSASQKVALTIKYNSSGTEVWKREFRGNIDEHLGGISKKINVDASGDFYITGSLENNSNLQEYFFNKYDSAGVYLTSATYQSDGIDYSAYDISLDGDDIYITGLSNNGGSQQTTVVKYSVGNRDLTSVIVDSVDSHVDDEIIIRFSQSSVKHDVIDNENFTFGELQDFVDTAAINAMQAAYPNTTWATARTYKIFRGLKTSDTMSISRQGFEVPMQPFWATLLVVADGKDEMAIAEGLDSALFPHILYAHVNYLHEVHSDDPLYPLQHSLMSTTYPDGDLNIETAWTYETGKDHIYVGVYDGGIRYTHEDLGGEIDPDNGKIRGGKDFMTLGDLTTVENNGEPIHGEPALNGHGTRSAGVIGGLTNNTHGVAGIAGGNWPYLPGEIPTSIGPDENKGVSLYGMRIRSTAVTKFPLDIIISAVIEGASNTHEGYGYGLHVIHCGFGVSHVNDSPEDDNAVYDMQEHVFRNGVVLVASQGNLNEEQYITPAYARKEFWSIAVGSSASNGNKLEFSSYGTNMDVIAPGHNILIRTTSNNADDAYTDFGFTSAAAAHVSGVAALMLSHINPADESGGNLTPDDVEFLIQRYAEDKDETDNPDYSVGHDIYTGHGMIDAGNVMQHIDKNEYVIRHYYSNTVFDDLGGFGDDLMTEFKDETHPYGLYKGHVHTISRSVSHTLNAGDVIVNYWPLHSYTNSIKFDMSDDYQTRFEYEMDMHSVTLTGAVLTAETFHFLEDPDGNPVDFWYPFAPDETVKLAYSLHIKTDYASIDEENKEFLLSCYPNPTNGMLNLEFILAESANVGVEIFDINGRVVIKQNEQDFSIGQQNLKLDVNLLTSGIYAVRLKVGEEYYYEKFIKE